MTSRKLAAETRARVALLGHEADTQIELAAARLSSTVTKGSLLLVGAGLIAGSWAIEQIAEDWGPLPWAAVVLAFAAAAAAIFSLIPQPSLQLDLLGVIDGGLDTEKGSVDDLELLLLSTKTATITSLNTENTQRTRWVQLGYVFLLLALLCSTATLTVMLTS